MKKKILPLLLTYLSVSQVSAIEFYQYENITNKNKENIMEYNNVSFLINEGKYEKAKSTLEKIYKRIKKDDKIYENVIYQLGYVYMKLDKEEASKEAFEKISKIKSAKQSYITLLSNWYLFQYTGDFKYLKRNKDLYEIFKDYIINEKEIIVHINGDLLLGNFKEALEKYKKIAKEKQNLEHLLILNLLNYNKIESKMIIEKIRKEGVKRKELEEDLTLYSLFLNLQNPDKREVKEEMKNLKSLKIEKPFFKLGYEIKEDMLDRSHLQKELEKNILSPILKLNYVINEVKYLLNLDYKEELLKISTVEEHEVLKRRIIAQEWFKNNYNKDLYLLFEDYKRQLDLNDLNFQESYNLGIINVRLGKYVEAIEYFKRAFYLQPQYEYSALINLLIANIFKHNLKDKLTRLEKKQMENKIETSKDPFVKYIYFKIILKNNQKANQEAIKIKKESQKEIVSILNQLFFTKNKRNLENMDSFSKTLITMISEVNQFEKIKVIQEHFLLKNNPILIKEDSIFITDLKIQLAYIGGILKDKEIDYTLFDRPSYLRGISLIKIFEGKYLKGKELLEKLIVDYNIKDIITNQMLLLAYKYLGNNEKIESILSDKNITKEMYKLLLLSKVKNTFEIGDFETLDDLLKISNYQKNNILVIEPKYLIEKILSRKNIILKEKEEIKEK